jgi:hypothetical protein
VEAQRRWAEERVVRVELLQQERLHTDAHDYIQYRGRASLQLSQ